MRRALLLPLLIAVTASVGIESMGQQTPRRRIEYPKTKKIDHREVLHGVVVEDPYRWLEDLDSPETRAWIEAQNAVTFAYLASLPEREPLRRRLTELWNYPRWQAPERRGPWYFFFKNDGLQNQAVLYRQKGLDGTAEVLLDPNLLSEDGTVALTTVAFTRDGSRMVYGVSEGGSDWQVFRVREVATAEDRPDVVRWVKFSGASWTADGRGFFYSRFPAPGPGEDPLEVANRNQKVYYHRLGTDQSEDVLVYERPDEPEWGFSAQVTHDGRYLVLHVGHGTDERNRVYYMDLGEGEAPRLDGEVRKLLDAFDASYELVGSDGGVLYFLTNRDAPRYRLVAIDLASPEPESWREVIAESDAVLSAVRHVGGRFVAHFLRDAHSELRVYAPSGELEKEIELAGLGSVGGLTGEPDGNELFYSFESFLLPDTIYRYDLDGEAPEVLFAPRIDFDAERYETKQVFYRSKDGTRVPLFLTHRKDLVRDGTNRTYLYGYGGFNISVTPRFSPANLVWLERGGVYAVANLRGGGEYGEEWHRAGMLDKKQNVFDDFIAAAEYLVAERYTSPERLAIGGGSNGGLLVGAVMNQRPELFGAALPAVGVMDMLRFHLFTIGWAWVSDYGSPEDPEQFRVLYAYSPYHNLRPGVCYPATLVTTADHDDRVVPAHSFKYAARLQEVQSCDRPVLIRIQTRAGHGAGKPTSMLIDEYADRWAFLLANLR